MRIILCFVLFIISQNALAQKFMILGDSLSAAYGLQESQGWPALLAEKTELTLINASISGETTGGALARLPALLKEHQPTWVLVELGGNDGLRGFTPQLIEDQLQQIIITAKQHNAQPILMQIRIPPNYGPRYVERFTAIYPALAERHQIPLWPFFMDEIAIKPELMMQDGIHPTAEAQPLIRDIMLPLLAELESTIELTPTP
ncbi:arylesterase [Alishewanella sp. SMS8]|uniref:arylesterase n=1 Tax=Alishewanella sp. SMS8 TaxID=2994676 RepID=UPI0027422C74|nr:arylesterase [Alishewanella sp. SMS8]MDP5035383.1 arylesterase [Alishewanella sp.]MDP5458138.1 arylesterase [Alishewanella sp. SMS8]